MRIAVISNFAPKKRLLMGIGMTLSKIRAHWRREEWWSTHFYGSYNDKIKSVCIHCICRSADRRSLMTRANMADQCIKACKMFESLQKSSIEKYRKSLIQNCERSELRLHFEWTKVHQKCQKWSIFWKPKAYCKTVLQDRSKLVENAKIQKRHFE